MKMNYRSILLLNLCEPFSVEGTHLLYRYISRDGDQDRESSAEPDGGLGEAPGEKSTGIILSSLGIRFSTKESLLWIPNESLRDTPTARSTDRPLSRSSFNRKLP